MYFVGKTAIFHILVSMGVAIVYIIYQSLWQWFSNFDLCIFARIMLVTCLLTEHITRNSGVEPSNLYFYQL